LVSGTPIHSLSVLICTFNRAPLLDETLTALCAARVPEDCSVEILVIDNNSTDNTAEVVSAAAARCGCPVKYAVERRQGKSFALNRGLTMASGDVVALTDDDVIPAGDWLVRIADLFQDGKLMFVFGKVLPSWEVPPPAELLTTRARDIWGPLALVDYGDARVAYDADSFGCNRLPIGANLAIRRRALEQIGGWRTDLGKVDNSLIAGEDHEICVRLYRAGLYSGVYDPDVVVRHFVPATRLTRAYFRRWFYWHGRTMARMADEIYLDLDLRRVPYLGGVPRFLYRQILEQIVRWVGRAGRGDALALLTEELKLIEYWGFVAESWSRRIPRARYPEADRILEADDPQEPDTVPAPDVHAPPLQGPAPAVSVVISTYNRADRLPLALEALLAQVASVPYEIVVVDNNSTDATPAVVASLAARADGRIRYAFEPRQGLSYGRNTGIALSRGGIIALSDDDVRVAPDYVEQLARAFAEHPEVDYVGGRVLPNWLAPPPRWLTTAHWSPLALQDYGPAPMVVGRERAQCLVGASLAFRRQVFDLVGLFTPALGRIKDGIGSTEDHDMQLRVWRADMQGLYTPSVVALADVTPDRLTKAYHRRWHRGHGRHCAMMRLRELVPADLGPMSEPTDLVMLFGSPAFVYADLLRASYRWLEAAVRRRDPLFYANQLRHVSAYIGARYAAFRRESPRGAPGELYAFSRAYLRKRLRRVNVGTSSA
jgi:glycosyltransferase involved in cell wall biosynthesis